MIHTRSILLSFQKIPILLFPLIALIGSICLCNFWYQGNISFWIMVLCYSIPVLMAATCTYYTTLSRTIILLILISLASGFFRTMQVNHNQASFPFTTKPVTIHGTVTNKTKNDQSLMKLCISFQLSSVTNQTENYSTNRIIQIYTQPNDTIEIGDTLEIQNVRLKKPNNENFGRYLMKEGILTTIFVQKIDYTLLYRPTYSLRRWFYTYKNNLLVSFEQQLSPATFHLFSSLFLGARNKKALEFVNNQFKQWGILHYLARSGLHLAVVITIYEASFRLMPFSFMIKHLIFLLLGGIYFILSWSSISFIRAFLMFLGYKLSALSKTQPHFLHILLTSCFILLLTNPIQLFFIDFQLSFCLTFALGWLNLYRTDQMNPKLVKY